MRQLVRVSSRTKFNETILYYIIFPFLLASPFITAWLYKLDNNNYMRSAGRQEARVISLLTKMQLAPLIKIFASFNIREAVKALLINEWGHEALMELIESYGQSNFDISRVLHIYYETTPMLSEGKLKDFFDKADWEKFNQIHFNAASTRAPTMSSVSMPPTTKPIFDSAS